MSTGSKDITEHPTDRIGDLRSGNKHSFQVKTEYQGQLLEVEDTHFHFDSSVLLPEPVSERKESNGQEKITGLAILAACFRQNQKKPEQQLLVVGHTDRSGGDAYNQRLSERRARNVWYALQGDRQGWVDVADAQHVVKDVQQILHWRAAAYDWNCDPGPIDGIEGPKTKQAVHNFQQRYNEEFGRSIAVDGIVGPQTWGAFFDVYMEELRRILGIDQKGLETKREALQFLSCPSIGCGEDHPVTADRRENYRHPADRRVEVLFFDPGEEPPGDCADPRNWCETLYGDEKYTFTPISPKPVGPPPGSTPANDVRVTGVEASHFVPGSETLAIDYEIEGPLPQVNTLRFVVVRKDAPGTRILDQSLAVPDHPTGTHTWDGSVTDSTFEGVANLKEAPYVVQFILHEMSGAKRESNTEQVDVLPAKVEIFVEDPGSSKLNSDEQSIVQDVKKELASNHGEANIVYGSPVFKKSSAEMNNDSSYQEYENEWGQGIRIPLYTRIWLKGKSGDQKRCAKATTKTKVLWDVRLDDDAAYDDSLDDRSVHSAAKGFLKKVSDYKKAKTDPEGRTAHKYFGGMRARASQRTATEEQWKEMESDWSLQAPSKRGWAAYTTCKTGTPIDAETGVFFRGGRMAGDIHHVTAYVEADTSLDTQQDKKLDDLPSEQRSNTLHFENWRRVEIVQNNKSGASTTELDLKSLDAEYDKAAMEIESASGVSVQNVQGSWETHYQAVITKLGTKNSFIKNAALQDPGVYPVRYRDYVDYWERAHPDVGFFGRLWHRIKAFFGAADEETYRKECDKHAYEIYSETLKKFPLKSRGLTFYKFGADGDHNQWEGSYTAGIAPDIPGYTGRHKAVFLVFKEGKGTDTLIHEVGHLLFLAHAPGHFDPGEQPPGFQPNAHNEDEICLMSYHSDGEELCGLCLLKLEGWKYTKINKDGTVS